MTRMTRPRLLDLFSGAGGSAVGYHRTGFDVTGVDIAPQPRYPFEFHQGDAIEYLAEHGSEFDAIHASPPCQAFTTMSNRHRGVGGKADPHPELIAAVRALLPPGIPYVIENVPGARREMRNPITLHGGMFGLGVDRPRLFESNCLIMAGEAPRAVDPLGIYGTSHDGRRLFTRSDGTIQRAAANLEDARRAMGIEWMEWRELTQAIPPAYTEHIGRQLIRHVAERAA